MGDEEPAEVPPLRPEERAQKASAFAAETEPQRAPPPPPQAAEPEAAPDEDAVPFIPPELELDMVDCLKLGFAAIDAVIVEREPRWRPLSEKELNTLAKGWAPAAEAYLPKMVNTPLGAGVTATAIVVGPRIFELRQARQQEAALRIVPTPEEAMP